MWTGDFAVHHPAHLDGRSLIILRERDTLFRSGFEVVASGDLHFDGETLMLESPDGGIRIVPESECSQILTVTRTNQIPECAGFQLVILETQ